MVGPFSFQLKEGLPDSDTPTLARWADTDPLLVAPFRLSALGDSVATSDQRKRKQQLTKRKLSDKEYATASHANTRLGLLALKYWARFARPQCFAFL